MDAILLAFIQSTQAGGSDRQVDLLERLIVEEAAPIVRRTIRHRLHFHLSDRGMCPVNPDAEDLYHDILMRLVRALNRMAVAENPPNIQDFRQYVLRVAANGCHDYLRSRYPRRTRLKDRIRDQLERHPEFDLWRSERDEMLCGFAGWRDRPPVRREALGEAGQLINIRLPLSGRKSGQLVILLRHLLTMIQGPVDLEAMVAVVADLLEISEDRYQSLDAGFIQVESADGVPGADEGGARWSRRRDTRGETFSQYGAPAHSQFVPSSNDQSETAAGEGRLEGVTLPDFLAWAARPEPNQENGEVGMDRRFDERIALRRMWEIWITLPPRPRETFFYSFSTSRGEDLLTLLFQARVATPSEVARVLDLPLEVLMERWREMPMRNVDLANQWGVDRQQVNKWRFQALKMIEKRLL